MNSQHVREQLEEYSLGWLDPETQARVEEHLAVCAICRAQADAYAETLATLPEVLAQVSAYSIPEHLRERVVSRASRSAMAQEGHDTVAQASTAAVPPPVAVRIKTWMMPQPRLRLAFIVICLLLVSLLLWSVQLTVVLARERALRAEFAQLVGQQEIVLEVIDSNKTERRVLLPPPGASGASRAYGKVFTRTDMPHVVAMAARLTPPPAGEAYHLWLTRQDVTFLAGTLHTNDEGFGLILYDDTVDGPQYSRAMVTLQPVGSTAPVEPPVLEWVLEE